MCRSCYEKDLRRRNPEYAERQRKNSRAWASIPENKQRKRDMDREYRARLPRGSKAHKAYGITREEYESLMSQPCGICGGEASHLDHDHRHCPRGKGCRDCIRGALCHRCNLGMGYYEGWFLANKEKALAWSKKLEGKW